MRIPTYIINLKKRADRKENILKEFSGRDEFVLTIVEAFEHSFGALGLWYTIVHVLKNLAPHEADFIIIGEDDLQFTEYYSKRKLLSAIREAKEKKADVLLGGISWFTSGIQISKNLFWAENFSGLPFTVIFKEFFNSILQASLEGYDAADYHIAALTKNALFVYPYFVTQKEFGYSDATPKNNVYGRLGAVTDRTAQRLKLLSNVKKVYSHRYNCIDEALIENYENATISTYVTGADLTRLKLEHINEQFFERTEFDLKIVPQSSGELELTSVWSQIKHAVQKAVEEEDDVIIICRDDHEFTLAYSKDYFLKNVFEAYFQGAKCLSGGPRQFENTIPITENIFWVDFCFSSPFVVLFKSIFPAILKEPIRDTLDVDVLLARLTSNKMLLYPFVSRQKYFKDTNASTDIENEENHHKMVAHTSSRLASIQEAFMRYNKQNAQAETKKRDYAEDTFA